MTDRDKLLLTPGEVAQRLSITDTQVYRLIRSGTLPAVILPDMTQIRVPASDLAAWIRGLPRKAADDMEKTG